MEAEADIRPGSCASQETKRSNAAVSIQVYEGMRPPLKRDAFTAERGYSVVLNPDGMPPNRDRVWLSMEAAESRG